MILRILGLAPCDFEDSGVVILRILGLAPCDFEDSGVSSL